MGPRAPQASERPFLGLRTKIILSFAAVFTLSAVVALWSIWMTSDLGDRVRFLELADDLQVEVQQARRSEMNYLLFGSNYADTLTHLDSAKGILVENRETIERVLGQERSRTMADYIFDYHELFEGLASQETEGEREARVGRLREDGAKMASFASDFVDRERAKVESRLVLARRVLFSFLGGLLALIFFIVNWWTRQLLFSLKRLMMYTERISLGDYTPLPPRRRFKDEFSRLAEAFNQMTGEISRRQEILVESHKLRAVGTLVAGVAHELNNPLNNTLLSAEVLREDLASLPDAEKAELVDDVIAETQRSQRIVSNLLDFARESQTSMLALDLGRIVSESVELVANQARLAKVQLETEFDADLPLVHGDEQLLKQVFVNLILNAVDALPTKGRIHIHACRDREPGFLTVEIQDDGPGMAPHVQQRIFEPFFTTKERGQGTGLGLSVSKGIVEKLGGVLHVRSTLGEGSTFILSLPTTDAPAELMSQAEPQGG